MPDGKVRTVSSMTWSSELPADMRALCEVRVRRGLELEHLLGGRGTEDKDPAQARHWSHTDDEQPFVNQNPNNMPRFCIVGPEPLRLSSSRRVSAYLRLPCVVKHSSQSLLLHQGLARRHRGIAGVKVVRTGEMLLIDTMLCCVMYDRSLRRSIMGVR